MFLDACGFPTLCRPVEEGGVGFDYRLGMGLPDFWKKMMKVMLLWFFSLLLSKRCKMSTGTLGKSLSKWLIDVGRFCIGYVLY